MSRTSMRLPALSLAALGLAARGELSAPLDPARGMRGQRMGATLRDDRSFDVRAGRALDANKLYAFIGVGTVTVSFDRATADAPIEAKVDPVEGDTGASGSDSGISG